MCFFNHYFLKFKNLLLENSFESLLWLVNIIPNLAGFSLRSKKISALFWIVLFFLLIYVYAVGNIVYQMNYARNANDYIKSYVNLSILILTATNGYWFLTKRPLLIEVLDKISKNDQLARRSIVFRKKHEKSMAIIKRIICVFYGCNYTNAILIYLPNRVNLFNDYAMTQCVGLQPLTKSPNGEICLILICAQELSIMAVVLNYQALLLFLVAHTSVMYQMLSADIGTLHKNCDRQLVEEKLLSLIERHVLTLDIADNLKTLYSMPIGVNFETNAIMTCAFFFLPLQEWVQLIPIIVYCFLVFFLYCILGQRLTNAAEDFARSLYSCGWENFTLSHRKTVYVMLLIAQKPVQMMAADIVPVNVYTFASIVQTIYKFVTVVKL